MNKPAFRQRPIDYAKPLQLIKEINEVKKTAGRKRGAHYHGD